MENITALVKEAREALTAVPGADKVDFEAVVPFLMKKAQEDTSAGDFTSSEDIRAAAEKRYAENEARRQAELEGEGRTASPASLTAGGILGVLGALFGGAVGGVRGATFGGLFTGLLGFLAHKTGSFPESFQNLLSRVMELGEGDAGERMDKAFKDVYEAAAEGFKDKPPEEQVAITRKALANSDNDITKLPGYMRELIPEAPPVPAGEDVAAHPGGPGVESGPFPSEKLRGTADEAATPDDYASFTPDDQGLESEVELLGEGLVRDRAPTDLELIQAAEKEREQQAQQRAAVVQAGGRWGTKTWPRMQEKSRRAAQQPLTNWYQQGPAPVRMTGSELRKQQEHAQKRSEQRAPDEAARREAARQKAIEEAVARYGRQQPRYGGPQHERAQKRSLVKPVETGSYSTEQLNAARRKSIEADQAKQYARDEAARREAARQKAIEEAVARYGRQQPRYGGPQHERAHP